MYDDNYSSMPIDDEMGKILKMLFRLESSANYIQNHLPYMLYHKDRMRFEIVKLNLVLKQIDEASKKYTPPRTYMD